MINLTGKTPSHVRISFKGNFLIKTSEVLFLFHNVIYSRFTGLVESFNPPKNSCLREVIKILKADIIKVNSKNT